MCRWWVCGEKDIDMKEHLVQMLPDELLAEKCMSKWCILAGYRGSKAHGMYMPNTDADSIDDIDLMSICVPPIEYYYGLKKFGSRGTKEIMKDPFDIVVYEALKFIRLLRQANPNVLCMLWLKDYLHLEPSGEMLIKNRHLFATQHAYKSFVGYAMGQLKKMTAFTFEGYMGEKRKALVRKHGYDCKNASHCIRILRMGIEFLDTGELIVERPDRDELLSIKRGALTLHEVQDMAEMLFAELKTYGGKCSLPTKTDDDKINQLCVDIVKNVHQ